MCLYIKISLSLHPQKKTFFEFFIKLKGAHKQDTHTLEKDESNWRLLWRGPIFFSHLSTRQGGVMIAFSRDFDFVLLCLIEIIKGRLLYVKFKSNEKNLSCYQYICNSGNW